MVFARAIFENMKKLVLFLIIFFSWGKAQDFEEIEKQRNLNKKPLVILFSTDWCGICHIQKRKLKKLPQNLTEKMNFVSINPEKYYKDITFFGKKYTYVSNGTTGLHSLAYHLAGERVPAYPFWVFIDFNNNISTYEGILEIENLEKILK